MNKQIIISLVALLSWQAAPAKAEAPNTNQAVEEDRTCGGPIMTDPCLAYGAPHYVKIGVVCVEAGKTQPATKFLISTLESGLTETDETWVRSKLKEFGCFVIGGESSVAPVKFSNRPDARGFISETEVLLIKGNEWLGTIFFSGFVGKDWMD